MRAVLGDRVGGDLDSCKTRHILFRGVRIYEEGTEKRISYVLRSVTFRRLLYDSYIDGMSNSTTPQTVLCRFFIYHCAGKRLFQQLISDSISSQAPLVRLPKCLLHPR